MYVSNGLIQGKGNNPQLTGSNVLIDLSGDWTIEDSGKFCTSMRIAAVGGGVLVVMMWSAVLPPANNVFMDEHLIYLGVLATLALTSAGDTFGFGRWWARVPFVARNPWLK